MQLYKAEYNGINDEIEFYNEDMFLVITCSASSKILLNLAVTCGMQYPEHSHDDFAWSYLKNNVFGQKVLMDSAVSALLSY